MPRPHLNLEGIAAITAALAQHTAEVAQANRKLFAVIKSVPGGVEGIRAILGARGLTAVQIDGFFTGQVPHDARPDLAEGKSHRN